MNSDRLTRQLIIAVVGLAALLLALTEALLAWTARPIPPELASLTVGAITGLLGLLGKTEGGTE